MSFGQNLQFLRKMSNRMIQEELAEKLNGEAKLDSARELARIIIEVGEA